MRRGRIGTVLCENRGKKKWHPGHYLKNHPISFVSTQTRLSQQSCREYLKNPPGFLFDTQQFFQLSIFGFRHV